MPAGITVVEVMRQMRVDLDKRHTWAIGAMLQRAYAAETGRQPPKDNRRKTNSGTGGSHCFAIYPPEWRHRIEEAVRKVEAMPASQFDLFEENSMSTETTEAGAPETPPSAPRFLTVGNLRAALEGVKDDALVLVDNGKAHCVPVALPPTAFTARELPGDRFRLGGGGAQIPVCVIRAT